MAEEADAVVEALRAGRLAVIPTDTVYGLVCAAADEAAAAALYALKGRDATQPVAVVVGSVDEALSLLPELDRGLCVVVAALLPGAFTLVLPNPARRFAWLNRTRPEAIGVRAPVLPAAVEAVLAAVGPIAATSANLPGGPDPRRLEDVPAPIRAAVAAVLDLGPLPGVASTVIDLT